MNKTLLFLCITNLTIFLYSAAPVIGLPKPQPPMLPALPVMPAPATGVLPPPPPAAPGFIPPRPPMLPQSAPFVGVPAAKPATPIVPPIGAKSKTIQDDLAVITIVNQSKNQEANITKGKAQIDSKQQPITINQKISKNQSLGVKIYQMISTDEQVPGFDGLTELTINNKAIPIKNKNGHPFSIYDGKLYINYDITKGWYQSSKQITPKATLSKPAAKTPTFPQGKAASKSTLLRPTGKIILDAKSKQNPKSNAAKAISATTSAKKPTTGLYSMQPAVKITKAIAPKPTSTVPPIPSAPAETPLTK